MTLDAVGGVWRYAMDLASALSNQNVETVFAVLGPSPSAHQAGEASRIGELVTTGLPLDWMCESETELARIGDALGTLARRHAIDVVQVNVPSQAQGIAVGVPVIAVSHSCVATWWDRVRGDPLPPEWRWQRSCTRAGLENADGIVCPSLSHAEAVSACYGPGLAVSVVHNAVGFPCRRNLKSDVVFAAGRWWDEGKNGEVLDRAASRCCWPVVMAGAVRGPQGQSVALSNVRATGELAAPDTRAAMAEAGIFVAPSRYEPFGLAPLEAARSGCALVLSDIPVFRELWDGAALFFPPDDPAALADAVNALVDDAELRTGMAAVACLRSLMFTPDRQALAMRSIYDRAMARTVPVSEEA
ncbi:MAG: glycosyltransferase family 4 protein [Rhizobiaceae bacterium]|nr:glycosyltransferase family 4 protein [Rhizobiaceae bacterium]MCV0407474.1 glycosyltransferase family 4 protein [Rhizobiaceae bacterium]